MEHLKELFILAVCLMVLGFSCCTLVGIWFMYREGVSEYEELQEYIEEVPEDYVEDNEKTAEPEETAEKTAVKVNFEELKNINQDIVAWIRIESLGIDYPVVQGDDNDHYLHYTFRGEKNAAGSIFLDYRNQADFSDPKIILYGHNMKNGSMFGNLKKYQEESIAPEEQIVTVYLPGNKEWKFQVQQCRTVKSNDACYELDSVSEEDLESKVLILSTCSYHSDLRLIVETSRIGSII